MEISSNSGKYALAYAPGDEFPKSVSLEDPSVTLCLLMFWQQL
jgi:DNA polymerase-3 subunit beta